MQVNPEDSPPDIYVTWSNPRTTDFENFENMKHVYGFPLELRPHSNFGDSY